jgi:hypothetical protein
LTDPSVLDFAQNNDKWQFPAEIDCVLLLKRLARRSSAAIGPGQKINYGVLIGTE